MKSGLSLIFFLSVFSSLFSSFFFFSFSSLQLYCLMAVDMGMRWSDVEGYMRIVPFSNEAVYYNRDVA